MSLLNQLSGIYAKMALKEKDKSTNKSLYKKFQDRSIEISTSKINIIHLSYPEKVQEIQKYSQELKDVLDKESTL